MTQIKFEDAEKCKRHNEIHVLLPVGMTGCYKCYNEWMKNFKIADKKKVKI